MIKRLWALRVVGAAGHGDEGKEIATIERRSRVVVFVMCWMDAGRTTWSAAKYVDLIANTK